MAYTLIELSDYGLLKVSGRDAKKLLQDQLTCDIAKLSLEQSCLGAHCNPQGRIISLCRLLQFQQDYYLLMPHSMIALTVNAIKKYARFYQATLSDVDPTLAYIGLSSTEPVSEWKQQLQSTTSIIAIPASNPSRYLIMDPTKAVIHNLATVKNNLPCAATWQQLDIQAGIPSIYPETSGQLLPHELNLLSLEAVSLNKGCYTGQEIIARMHYRGQSKNQLYRASITHYTRPLPGTDIYCQQETTTRIVGIVIDSYPLQENQYEALIVVAITQAKNTHLFLQEDRLDYLSPSHKKNFINIK